MARPRKPAPSPVPDLEAARRKIEELEASLEELGRRITDLEGRERRFRKVFEHSNDGVFIFDPTDDAIIDVNARACTMLGYARDEMLSMKVSDIHPHEMEKLRSFASGVFQDEKGWTDQLSCMTKAGDFLSAEISASMLEVGGRKCMIAMVRDTSERHRLALEKEYLHDEIREVRNPLSIIGESPALKKVLEQVEMVAPTDATVMIIGESGTGKELVAAAIHEMSSRRGRAMVSVNCASIPSELFESEFFGHVKGSFTGAVRDRIGRFELAHESTLFLDEIGEIPVGLQGKLLRVLQEGRFERVGEERTRKVDVRIIAATNRDLPAEAKAGRFRQDLYYRLSVFPIEIPPLRDRPQDIVPLTSHFAGLSCRRLGLPCPGFSKEDARLLESYRWPGNVRELQNIVDRAMILGGGRHLEFAPLLAGDPIDRTEGESPPSTSASGPLTLSDLRRMEREVIVDALQRSAWKIYGAHGAASKLGLKPTTLRSRMKKMGITRPSSPETP